MSGRLQDYHLRELSSQLLAVSGHLPRMKENQINFLIREAIMFSGMPQKSCQWLMDVETASALVNGGVRNAWYLVHQECFVRPKRLSNRSVDTRLALLEFLFDSVPHESSSHADTAKETLRWSIRVCLVLLTLTQIDERDNIIDLNIVKELIERQVDIIDMNIIRQSRMRITLSKTDRRRLLLTRSLLLSVTRRLNGTESGLILSHLPNFDEVWNLIADERDHHMMNIEGGSLHWQTSLFTLYIQLDPDAILSFPRKLEQIAVRYDRVWPLDWITLLKLQFEPRFADRIELMIEDFSATMAVCETLQKYMLEWAFKYRSGLQSGSMAIYPQHLLSAIPLEARLYFARKSWMASEYYRVGYKEFLGKLEHVHSDFYMEKDETPYTLLRRYLQYIYDNGMIGKQSDGLFVVKMQAAKDMKLITSFMTLSCIFDIPLPQFNPVHLSVLFDLDGERLTTVLAHPDLFQPITASQERPRRSQLQEDMFLARVFAAQRRFHQVFPLSRMFKGPEMIRILTGSMQ